MRIGLVPPPPAGAGLGLQPRQPATTARVVVCGLAPANWSPFHRTPDYYFDININMRNTRNYSCPLSTRWLWLASTISHLVFPYGLLQLKSRRRCHVNLESREWFPARCKLQFRAILNAHRIRVPISTPLIDHRQSVTRDPSNWGVLHTMFIVGRGIRSLQLICIIYSNANRILIWWIIPFCISNSFSYVNLEKSYCQILPAVTN